MRKLITAIIIISLMSSVVYAENNLEKLSELFKSRSELDVLIYKAEKKAENIKLTENKLDYGICTRDDLRSDVEPEKELERLNKELREIEESLEDKSKQLENVESFISAYESVTSKQIYDINKLIREYYVEPVAGKLLGHPDPTGRLTSKFGVRLHPIFNRMMMHTGIDIANSLGSPILSSEKGVVLYANVASGYGKVIIVMHEDGYYTLYAHLNEHLVTKGDIVEKGQVIGRMGDTGLSTGVHLHFEVIKGTERVNPLEYLEN